LKVNDLRGIGFTESLCKNEGGIIDSTKRPLVKRRLISRRSYGDKLEEIEMLAAVEMLPVKG
jgi:hypothetical protein